MKLARVMAVTGFALASVILSGDVRALSPEQCLYFSSGSDGRTAICHATEASANRFVLLRVPSNACTAHSDHPLDFVSVDGTSCDQSEFLPVGAPCDATLACVDGSACTNGICTLQPQNLSPASRLSTGRPDSTGFRSAR